MIGWLLAWVEQAGRKVLGVIAAALALLTFGWLQGRQGAKDRQAKQEAKRASAGTAATNKAARSGKTPEEIAREGDGRW